MEMDKLGVITTFLHSIVVYNIPLLYGTVGEITVEKSGSLNLGVEGIMAVGAIFGYLVGCWTNNLILGILTGFLAGALCGLLFAVLTVSLQANQNITGLTLTTFGLGVYFFVGNGVKAVSWPAMNDYANIKNGFADVAIPGLSQIPVIGNGDLHTAEDVLRMKAETGCDGFMIGRGAQGNPWIFAQILHKLETGEDLPRPTMEEVVEMVLRHARMQIETKGEYIGIREIRKHAAWYTAGYPNSSRLRGQINEVENYDQLKQLFAAMVRMGKR